MKARTSDYHRYHHHLHTTYLKSEKSRFEVKIAACIDLGYVEIASFSLQTQALP